MGGRCCSDRKGSIADKSQEPRKTSQSIMKMVPDGSTARPSELLGIKGKDAEKFDEAFANMDIPVFVELLSSENSLGEGQLDEVPEHPWADLPASVGALAATQLAVIASMDDANVVSIRQAGATSTLAKFLKPGVPTDRRDAGVVLLVFMTSTDGESAAELGQRQLLPDLLRVVGDSSAHRGLRAAVSTILINVLLEHQASASRFIRENGVVNLLKACDSTGCKPQEEPFYLELVENFLELAEPNDNGAASKFLPSIRKAVESQPNLLNSLARKYPKTELANTVTKLLDHIS